MASKALTAKLETRHLTKHSLFYLVKMPVIPNNSIKFPALFSSGKKKKVYYQRTKRLTTIGLNLDLLQHPGFSSNNSTAAAILQKRRKKIALMSVVKLIHISSSKVFWSQVTVKMFTEKVY